MSGKPAVPKIMYWSSEQLKELYGLTDDQWQDFALTPTHERYDADADDGSVIPSWHRSVMPEVLSILAERYRRS